MRVSASQSAGSQCSETSNVGTSLAECLTAWNTSSLNYVSFPNLARNPEPPRSKAAEGDQSSLERSKALRMVAAREAARFTAGSLTSLRDDVLGIGYFVVKRNFKTC